MVSRGILGFGIGFMAGAFAYPHMNAVSTFFASVLSSTSSYAKLYTSKNSKKPCRDSPSWHVIINNVSKRSNIGTMIRSCAAFNCKSVFVIARPGKKQRKVNFFGSKGTKAFVKIEYFDSLEKCRAHCILHEIEILAVEIGSSAESVSKSPFLRDTAFFLGNEGQGLSEKELQYCDRSIYIPHYGNGTASLNVTVAASIIFHRFATWAKYEQQPIKGAKYVINQLPTKKGPVGASELKIHCARKAKKAANIALEASKAAQQSFLNTEKYFK